jgi:hypothetical protein
VIHNLEREPWGKTHGDMIKQQVEEFSGYPFLFLNRRYVAQCGCVEEMR